MINKDKKSVNYFNNDKIKEINRKFISEFDLVNQKKNNNLYVSYNIWDTENDIYNVLNYDSYCVFDIFNVIDKDFDYNCNNFCK